jgi:hypothetical protein
MEGILYVTDDRARIRFVQIDLEKHGKLWQDFFDGYLATEVSDEETISLEELENELRESGFLDEIPDSD